MPRLLVGDLALAVLCACSPFTRTAAAQGVGLASRSKGRADAPVTVFEMSDFQCPFCRQFALETLPVLEREYVATGKVRLVYIDLPLTDVHRNAFVAARVALCAARQGQTTFWAVHDLLFQRQPQWAERPDPAAYLLALADSGHANHAALAACLASPASAAAVQADAAAAIKAGAHSTPTFYIEGGMIEGAAPAAVFRAVLDSVYRAKTSH